MNELLDVSEASELLGLNEQTVRRLAREGKIACVKVGGAWRFPKDILQQPRPAEDHSIKSSLRPKSVLVVDDDPHLCKQLSELLRMENYLVKSKYDGAEVLEMNPQLGPDLVIMDVNMPRLNGVDTLVWIRKVWGSIPVILMTGFPDAELAMGALASAPITLAKKPLNLETLLSMAQQLTR